MKETRRAGLCAQGCRREIRPQSRRVHTVSGWLSCLWAGWDSYLVSSSLSRSGHCQSGKWPAEGNSLRDQQWDLGAFSPKERGVGEVADCLYLPRGAHMETESLVDGSRARLELLGPEGQVCSQGKGVTRARS